MCENCEYMHIKTKRCKSCESEYPGYYIWTKNGYVSSFFSISFTSRIIGRHEETSHCCECYRKNKKDYWIDEDESHCPKCHLIYLKYSLKNSKGYFSQNYNNVDTYGVCVDMDHCCHCKKTWIIETHHFHFCLKKFFSIFSNSF